MIEEYKKIIEDVTDVIRYVRMTKGCSGFGEKTYLIGFLIYYFNCKVTLDLGVYTGGSMFPQAKIHNKYTGGKVYGVDPYTKSDMEQHDYKAPDFVANQNELLSKLDFEELYNYIINLIKTLKYEDNVVFLRQRSDQAIKYFIENNIFFDLMFIDGNHDINAVLSDVTLYIPRLKDDGIFIMDDLIWPTIAPAYNYAKTKLSVIYESPTFAILQNTNKDTTQLKNLINELVKS